MTTRRETIYVVMMDPSYRYPALGIARGLPNDPIKSFEPLTWHVPWTSARVMGVSTPPKVARKVLEDARWIKKAWKNLVPKNEPKRVIMEWTRVEFRNTGMMHFLMYVGMMYLLMWVWSSGNVITVQPSVVKSWVKRNTGIKLTPAEVREKKAAKLLSKKVVEELRVINDAKGLPSVDEIADSRRYVPIAKDRDEIYEGLCDMICVGMWGLAAWTRVGPPKVKSDRRI